MDNINIILWVSRWLHIAAAIVAIGGAAFVRFALLPGARQTLDEESYRRLRESVRTHWGRFLHASIALLLATGMVNFAILAMPPKVDPMPYHAIFGVKFLAALSVFAIAVVLTARASALAKARQHERGWLNALLALAAGIILLSGLLSQVRAAHRTDSLKSADVSEASRSHACREPPNGSSPPCQAVAGAYPTAGAFTFAADCRHGDRAAAAVPPAAAW